MELIEQFHHFLPEMMNDQIEKELHSESDYMTHLVFNYLMKANDAVALWKFL